MIKKNLNFQSVYKTFIVFLFLLCSYIVLDAGSFSIAHAQTTQCKNGSLQAASLDGVGFQLCLPFNPDHSSNAEQTDWVQSGVWIKMDPHQEFSIYAVPYGVNPAVDNLPTAKAGIAALYRQATLDLYTPDLILSIDSPSISIFGNSETGTTYLLPDKNGHSINSQKLVTEWIVEAGNRVWMIYSYSYGDFNSAASREAAMDSISVISLESQSLENTSTSLRERSKIIPIPPDGDDVHALGDLPTPSWWNGDCDTNLYLQLTGTSAYRLGATFRGLVACGPGGVGTGTYQYGIPTTFGGAGGTAQLEFQCAELPKRYLWQLYGIPPKSANGINVVNVYDNALPNLKKVTNGTANSGLAAGDIVSYNGPGTVGHTAIITSVTIDGSGNGSYTTIEQNSSATGTRTNTITNWFLNSNSGISVYLHDSNSGSGGSCSGPSLNSPNDGYVSSGQTISFGWSALSGCTFSGYTFRIKDTSNMDSGGSVIVDTGEGGTSRTDTIGTQWNNRDLYWGVRAANAPTGASWSVRRFRIEPGGSGGPTGYTKCADEDGTCNFSGRADVAYGASGSFIYKSDISLAIPCTTSAFGGTDPIQGTRKACYYQTKDNSWAYQLYDLGDYNGERYESNQTITDFSSIGKNDWAESIKINYGYEIIACSDANFSGACGKVAGPAMYGDINALAQGLRNGISSIKVCSGSCPTPPESPSLTSPANGQFFNEGQSINLAWSATGSEYYGEIWGGPGGSLSFGWQTGTSYNPGSLSAGYTYSWHAKTRNSNGESNWSSTWNFTVRPAAPTNLTASAPSCGQANLAWSDNSGNEEGYKIYRGGSLIATLGSGITSYQNTGLIGNTAYSYTVKAYRGSIESDVSNTANVTTPSCGPGAPILNGPANAITLNRTDTVSLSWNTSSGATQYYAEFWGGPGTNINSGWTSNISWAIGTQWGGAYQWHVKAKNSSGLESAWSETRILNIRPGTPANLSATAPTSDQIQLTWNASSDAPGNIDGYRIYRDGATVGSVGSTILTYQDSGLSCNGNYSYYVKAYKGSLESNASSTINTTPQACPPAIRAVGASSLDGNWVSKSSFVPGDSIQWAIDVENTTGVDAETVIGFTIKDPNNVIIHNSTYTITTGSGTWTWAISDTVGMPGGIYTLIGSVTYEGIKTERTTTYTVVAPPTQTLQFNSVGTQDGWVLESSETSNQGGKVDYLSTTFNVGDDATKKQYRGILSFSTGAALPDNAVITKVTLNVKKQATSGTGDPFTLFQGMMVDMKSGFFGTAASLATSDFQLAAGKSFGPFKPVPANGWYSFDLTPGKAIINKLASGSGLTQIRLRFKLDDNNNTVANYVKFYSGNYGTASLRPQLIIEYYVP